VARTHCTVLCCVLVARTHFFVILTEIPITVVIIIIIVIVVMILIQVDDVEVVINMDDVEMKTARSSGAGN
jgi:protein subunit release factor A